MTIWLAAVLGPLVPCAVGVAAALRGRALDRLVALQFATAAAALTLALMTFAFDQPAFIDLALSVSLLSLPGTLLFAFVLERWL